MAGRFLQPAQAGPALTAYIAKALAPQLQGPSGTLATAGMIARAALFAQALPGIITAHRDTLLAAGLLDSTGRIDIDAARDFANRTIEQTAQITGKDTIFYAGFWFGRDDVTLAHDIAQQFSET